MFVDSGSADFDIFKFSNEIGRENALRHLTLHLVYQTPEIMSHINLYQEEKFANFLNQIQKRYRFDVEYHNDLHGADVMQMCFFMQTTGGLKKTAKLSHLDIVSHLVAAACHDLDHDGFNNPYHINTMSPRAIRYHDQSVQENYHAAEATAILLDPECNFIEGFERDDQKLFRKRVVGCILATDMAKHTEDLEILKCKIEEKGVSLEKDNSHLLIDDSSPGALFDSQQFILEAALHSADLSPPTRKFEACKKWTYLLFQEFFHQGDCEKRYDVPVSFLCDRKTTSVPKSQPGFINFIVLPLFKQIVQVMPNAQDLYK